MKTKFILKTSLVTACLAAALAGTARADDARAFQSIKAGLTENGKERMKAYGDKLSDGEIKSLVAYVHTFNK